MFHPLLWAGNTGYNRMVGLAGCAAMPVPADAGRNCVHGLWNEMTTTAASWSIYAGRLLHHRRTAGGDGKPDICTIGFPAIVLVGARGAAVQKVPGACRPLESVSKVVLFCVIPAEAGIHPLRHKGVGARLRGHDRPFPSFGTDSLS